MRRQRSEKRARFSRIMFVVALGNSSSNCRTSVVPASVIALRCLLNFRCVAFFPHNRRAAPVAYVPAVRLASNDC